MKPIFGDAPVCDALFFAKRHKWLDLTYLMTKHRISLGVDQLPVGGFIKKTYNGKTHIVFVIDDCYSCLRTGRGNLRFFYRAQLFDNLSSITKIITGDSNISGSRFFKLSRTPTIAQSKREWAQYREACTTEKQDTA